MYPMIARIVWEALGRGLGVTTAQHDRSDEPTPEHDTTWLPVELALPARTRTKPEPWLTVHVTDVSGGFGVTKSAVKRWERVIAADKHAPSSSAFESALLERYSGCAYHRIGSRRVGAVRNHPATLRTSHGNAGNKGMGWALDAGHREELTPALVGAGIRSLAGGIEECYAAADDGPVHVVPHAVWSGQRRVDTDARTWRAIVLPVVEALGPTVCMIDLDACDRRKGGVPVRELKWARL